MRHVDRTQRTSIGWLGDVIEDQIALVEYIESELQAADIFTKDIVPKAWEHALSFIGMEYNAHKIAPG